MSYRTADPLPECALCEMPTARSTWQHNSGLCSRCAAGIAATVRMLPIRDPEQLERARELRADRALDDTVMVEGWKPPVPRSVAP